MYACATREEGTAQRHEFGNSERRIARGHFRWGTFFSMKSSRNLHVIPMLSLRQLCKLYRLYGLSRGSS